MLSLGFIPLVHERSENANSNDKNLKANIYHMALKTILQYIYPSLLFDNLRNRNTDDVAVFFKYKDSTELMCADGYKKHCYLVLVGLMID